LSTEVESRRPESSVENGHDDRLIAAGDIPRLRRVGRGPAPGAARYGELCRKGGVARKQFLRFENGVALGKFDDAPLVQGSQSCLRMV